MRNLILSFALILSAAILSHAEQCGIIPQPAKYQATDGSFSINGSITISAPAGNNDIIDLFISQAANAQVNVKKTKKNADIALSIDSSLGEEAYTIDVTTTSITIKAADTRGFFYGLQTLIQLIRQGNGTSVQCCSIDDSPRFSYRGIMLDVTRYFMPQSEILRIIDVAATLKINKLHLHLTDDNGWRMEIKKYPKLTSVGAWRVDRPEIFPGRKNQQPGEEATYGGYYTQKELAQVVKYAAARQITVIPEIEMPAHSIAAIASYPQMACPVLGDKFIGVLPGIGGTTASVIYCAGNDDVFSFIQDILDEVLAVFPSEYIHIGGDEAEKSHWLECPLCQARMKELGISDIEELQGYFMDRINVYLQSKGRKALGWDEITYGHPKEDVVLFGWQGQGNFAINYARQYGNRFVLTPARTLYLIRYQGPQWFEPFTYFGNNMLTDVYHYEPFKPDWDDALKSNLWGVQASLWTEFCSSTDDVEYLLFPRMIAHADMAWRPEGSADWSGFLNALDQYLPTLDQAGITHAATMFNIQHCVKPNNGKLNIELNCERPDVEIRYTTDGSQPSASSTLYCGQIESIEAPATITAATFAQGTQKGKTLTLNLSQNKATGCNIVDDTSNNKIAYALTNGVRGSDKISDLEWTGWYNTTAEFTVDLGSVQSLSQISLGAIAHSMICVALPPTLYVYTSQNGRSFTLLKQIDTPTDEVFAEENTKVELDCGSIDVQARYVKFVAINPGCVPQGYARDGTPTWMYFDEITIN